MRKYWINKIIHIKLIVGINAPDMQVRLRKSEIKAFTVIDNVATGKGFTVCLMFKCSPELKKVEEKTESFV